MRLRMRSRRTWAGSQWKPVQAQQLAGPRCCHTDSGISGGSGYRRSNIRRSSQTIGAQIQQTDRSDDLKAEQKCRTRRQGGPTMWSTLHWDCIPIPALATGPGEQRSCGACSSHYQPGYLPQQRKWSKRCGREGGVAGGGEEGGGGGPFPFCTGAAP